jgi:hypothetical protein
MLMLKVVLLAICLLGLGVLGMAVKIWAKKDGTFNGTCASNSPFLSTEGEACSYCGASADDKCKSPDIEASK